MYFLAPPSGPVNPTVAAAIRAWTARNLFWQSRQNMSSWPPSRPATVEEIAEALVDDPTVNQALALLVSPRGQAIEKEVASLFLAPLEAELLTEALTLAWNIIRDHNRPRWERADVLLAVGIGVASLIAIIAISRSS